MTQEALPFRRHKIKRELKLLVLHAVFIDRSLKGLTERCTDQVKDTKSSCRRRERSNVVFNTRNKCSCFET